MMARGSVYYTEIREEYRGKKLEHLLGEVLLKEALQEEYDMDLYDEPRSRGIHGKPFFSFRPGIHYNISYSGNYIYCILSEKPVGIDIQIEKELDYEQILKRMVSRERSEEILKAENVKNAFFEEWVIREAFIKFTGEGLSRDLKNLPLSDAWCSLFSPEEGYHGAIYSAVPLELHWKKKEVNIA